MFELLLFERITGFLIAYVVTLKRIFSDENAKVCVKIKADYTNAYKETLKK